ncbi:RNA-directed DNA polymerase [Ruegeria atlantica]|uniref:RNA-directed DNA polymerase n=1 Tax=Ruegeria atlantica TaxID=81569 RepID=UPI00147EC1D9|nr:RNA-directed DNA polymerase [Ruegeria atlantica]
MQSPKFKFLSPDLNDVFYPKNLKEEWKKRVRAQLRKQLIFDAIEYRDINDDIDNLASKIRREVTGGSYSVRQPKRYLAEKSRGLCRQMTLIHPRDLLVLERLSRSVYFELKKKAPSSSAFFEPDDGSFVKGFKQSDFEYGSFASWKKFQKAVLGFAKENKFIIVTDVANFYDFINFQHLRNIVASLADIREATLDLLIYVLNRLTWTPDFMPLTQVGMPQIETTATRVLANAMLYEVDRVCESSAISNYARFMDDMDIGVESIPAAKRVIRDVDLTLQSRQLRLNSSKTKILSQKDAYRHFCVAENLLLARFETIIEKGRHLNWTRQLLVSLYELWLCRTPFSGPGEKSRFNAGNGSKIHKYILSLLYQCGGKVPEQDLLWLVRNEPGMRSTALRYLGSSNKNNSNLAEILKILRSGRFVDDASLVDTAGYMLHAKFRKTARCISLANEYCQIAASQSDIGLHSAIFVASKFLPRSSILDLLAKNKERISSDYWLSRAAAGISPVFIGQGADWSSYHGIINEIDSEDAYDVLNYMLETSSASTYSVSLKAYLDAKNRSFPQEIYYPKVLVLLAAARNPKSSALTPKMHKRHPALKKDPFFSNMGF